MYRCPYCDKQFLRKERCESHARIHTGERPFVCGHLLQHLSSGQSTSCTKAYREKRELVKHQTRNGHVTPSLKSINPAPIVEVSTTLQSLMDTKLSQQRFGPYHENGLIKTTQTIPHNLYASFKLASLYFGLRLILVYPYQQ